MKKILGAVMAIVGVALVCTYIFDGGIASLIRIDLSGGNAFLLGKTVGGLLAALIGLALIYYGFKFWAERKWVLVVILIALGMGLAASSLSKGSDDSEIISGTVRKDFVDGATQTCLESSNKAFCTCYSNMVADETSYADIAAIKKNGVVPLEMQDRLQAASQYCATNIQ